MPSAAMPKATVDEECKALARKYKVWAPGQIRVPPPPLYSRCAEDPCEFYLRGLVAFGANGGHYF
jgi:hypothetical protein